MSGDRGTNRSHLTGRSDEAADLECGAGIQAAHRAAVGRLQLDADRPQGDRRHAHGSVAILTEAVHSSVDLIASIVAYVSVRKAEEPADESHRYGHEKLENLAAAIEGDPDPRRLGGDRIRGGPAAARSRRNAQVRHRDRRDRLLDRREPRRLRRDRSQRPDRVVSGARGRRHASANRCGELGGGAAGARPGRGDRQAMDRSGGCARGRARAPGHGRAAADALRPGPGRPVACRRRSCR